MTDVVTDFIQTGIVNPNTVHIRIVKDYSYREDQKTYCMEIRTKTIFSDFADAYKDQATFGKERLLSVKIVKNPLAPGS